MTKKELIELKSEAYREGIRVTLNFFKNEIGEEKVPLFLKCTSDIIDSKLIDEKIIMNNWISVKDRLPDNHQEVIILTNNKDRRSARFVLDKDVYYFMNQDNMREQYIFVTHWQPLPKPLEDK